MYNKPRSRLTLTRETNLHSNNSLASLQIVPTVSSSSSKQVYTQGSVFSRHTQQFDKSSVQPQEQVVFRPTQILPSDVSMKRYNHQGPPDFTLNQFAEKVPIHFRSNKKQIVPAAACAHDLSSPPDIVQDVEDSGRSSRSSSHLSPNTQKAPAFLPGDRVIFSESPSAPGIPVVYRTPEERSSNPDRLNLDRRKLTICPILEGEEQLRLLNYQHNMISKIQHLSSLKRLIFLDLYDNQIDEISGLNALKSLRVLMLGKNRIRRIENLDTLFKLDVLDLHGNQISNIENLTHLSELRVLNLAGNQIVHVDNLSGMDSLAELNLRRNRIRTVVDVDNLPSLQRLFLSFNEISSFEDIACLGESTSLSEISLDGNPIAQEQYYKQIVLRHMQQLKQLDMKRVTDLTGSSWTSSRKSHNPLFQLMSTPAFRSGLVNSGTVIPAQQDSQTSSANKDSPQVTKETTSKSVGGSLLKPKPSSRHFTDALQTTQLSASTGDITSVKLDDGQSVRRKNLSGKPRFLTVKSTNWAVNTTVSSKANSVSNSIVQATQQRQAQASNKTGMATKPVSAYTLYRSYSSSDPFTKTKFSMTKHAMSLMDPLSTSPMFTLSPVENGEDKGMQFGSEPSVDQSSVSTSRPVSEYSQNVEQNSTTTENNSLPKNSTSAGNSSTPENLTPTGNSSTPENSTPTGNNSTPENSTPVGNRSRPGSEKSLIGSVVQGRKLFQKTSNASETESNSEHDEETNLEKTVQKSILDIDLNLKKAEMRKAYWKIIDNKIVKVTGDYSDKPSEIVVKPCDMVKSESSDINKGVDSVIPGGDSANPEKNIEPENESDKGGKDLMNTETISENLFSHMAEGKYDISITRNFYHQSKGVDQVTMIIPKRDEDGDIEKKTGKDNHLEYQSASSFQLPVIKMAPPKLTGDEKDMSAAKSKLKTSESLPNLCKMHEFEKQKNFQEKGSSDLFKESVSKSQDVPGKLVKEPPLFSLSERSEKLTIFKEPPLPIQTKNNMDTIPETEAATTEASDSFNKEKKSRTGLSKSISAPSFFSEQSPSASAPPTFRSTSPTSPQNQTTSPTTPITQTGNTSKPTTPVQPNRKNSGTTMGQSVIKQSFKATPLMLTCSSVFPVVVAPAREEERRIALVMARKEEEKKRDSNKNQIMKEKKRLAINNARRQWEVMQGNMINKSGKLSRTPDLYANHVGSIPNSEFISPDGADENLEVESINRKSRLRNSQSDEELSEKHSSRGNSRPSSSHSSTNIDLPDIPKERPRTSSNSRKVEGTKNLKETVIFGQGDNRSGTDLSNLADLEGDTLTLYGTQSLEALDRSWGMQAAGAVTHIIFKFIDFEDIAKQLYKVRTKFPGVLTLTFSATNIRSYQQINALSSVRRFDNLIIENEGNPITKFTLWRTYVVFRLAHFALKKINDMEVTAADIVNAEKLYGPVSHITTSQLPQARLLSLVGEARMWCVSYDTRLMTDPNFIKMNLAFMPKKQQTLITPRDSPRNHMGEITKAFAAINTSKIEIKTKPPLKRSYSVTPTGTSQGLKYPNGFSRPSRLQKSNWHSTNDLTTKGPPELLPAPRVTEESLSRRTIKNDLLPAPRLPHEVIVAAKKIQSEVLATTHYIKPDIEQKAIQYTNSELIARQNYAEQVYRKLTASEDGYLQKSAYFQNSLSPKLNSSSQTTNSVLQKQAFSASQKPVQNSVMQKSYIQPENNKQSVTLKLISVQSAEEVSENERKQVLSITEDKSKKLLEGKLDKSQNEFVGRAGLTHQTVETVNTKQQEQNARRNFARSYVNEITKEAIFTDRKRNELLKQWPMIFHEMVYSAVADMSDMQSYMKKCLEELEKS